MNRNDKSTAHSDELIINTRFGFLVASLQILIDSTLDSKQNCKK